MALIEYETPQRKEPRFRLRVFAGLMGAGLLIPTALLLLVTIACGAQAIDASHRSNDGDAFGLTLAMGVMLAMCLLWGAISLRLIIVALRNVGESSASSTPCSDSAESD